MPNLRGSEWIILLLLVVLLFGARRLPDAARGLGRSLRIFKAETKGLADSDADSQTTVSTESEPTAELPASPPQTSSVTDPSVQHQSPPQQP